MTNVRILIDYKCKVNLYGQCTTLNSKKNNIYIHKIFIEIIMYYFFNRYQK